MPLLLHLLPFFGQELRNFLDLFVKIFNSCKAVDQASFRFSNCLMVCFS